MGLVARIYKEKIKSEKMPKQPFAGVKNDLNCHAKMQNGMFMLIVINSLENCMI